MGGRVARCTGVAVLVCLSSSRAHGVGGGFFGRVDSGLRQQQRDPAPANNNLAALPQLTERTPRGKQHQEKQWWMRNGLIRSTAAAIAATRARSSTRSLCEVNPCSIGNDDVSSTAVGDHTTVDLPAGTNTSGGRRRQFWGALTQSGDWQSRVVPATVPSRLHDGEQESLEEEASRGVSEGEGGNPAREAWRTGCDTRGGAAGRQWASAVEGLKNGLASGLAAACVKTVLQPFDTMKTVQQASTTRMSLLQAGKDLVARGGVPELYQGLGVTLVGSMPAVGVYFGLYQFVKNQMDAREGVPSYISITVSAGVGNLIASFFRVPYEVVKQRLQVGAYPNTMVALQSIYRQGGLGGFFGKGGLKTQWARDIPYAMVTLLVYESLQKAAARRRGPKSPKASPFENMVIGAVAGGMGSLVTNPMDMIKTRMMTSPEMYTGPMDAAWIALRKEGPQAFMKGATPRLLHKIPANAFFFVTYEFFRNVLGVAR